MVNKKQHKPTGVKPGGLEALTAAVLDEMTAAADWVKEYEKETGVTAHDTDSARLYGDYRF